MILKIIEKIIYVIVVITDITARIMPTMLKITAIISWITVTIATPVTLWLLIKKLPVGIMLFFAFIFISGLIYISPKWFDLVSILIKDIIKKIH